MIKTHELPNITNHQPTKIITDLDQSDNNQIDQEINKRKSRHFNKIKKYSDNFPRSKSAEKDDKKKVEISYFKVLINTKDEQIEKLVQKINDLHIYNDEFAHENERLQSEIQLMKRQTEMLSSSLLELQHKTTNCASCISWASEKENILKANKNLEDDIKMIKTLVYRLNVQVERYQDKFRKSNIEIDDERSHRHDENSNADERFWDSVNTHTLGPLLNAYEEIIKEKEDLINQHEIELNRFTGNLKETLEENECLQKEICEMRKGKDGWREERTRLQAQLDICRTKAELQTRRCDIAKEKLVEVLRCYEQKVQSQSLDLERIQEAYGRSKSELISYKNLNSQPDVIMESWKECQRLFEELKSQYLNDKTKLAEEVKELKQDKSELNVQFLKINEENITIKSQNQIQNKHLEDNKEKLSELMKSTQKLKESRDRLKARLRIALQWAHKLDNTREKMKNTWDELKQLEAIVRHKESQIRGLHLRHVEEVEKLQKKLIQRDETIKNILKDKAKANI